MFEPWRLDRRLQIIDISKISLLHLHPANANSLIIRLDLFVCQSRTPHSLETVQSQRESLPREARLNILLYNRSEVLDGFTENIAFAFDQTVEVLQGPLVRYQATRLWF